MDGIIKDIFEKYQVRKNKKQKTGFIDYTLKKAEELGLRASVEKGSLGVRNIVVGDADKARVIFTAHYDTCARLPFPNFLTPQNIFVYLLYNVALVLCFFAAAALIGGAVGFLVGILKLPESVAVISAEVIYICFLVMLFFGPANKHTANDNTSGVTVLFGIMKSLPESLRDKVAIVFFDHEESGLLGSGSFASKHKAIKENTLLVNFDCVSDGEDMLIVAKKQAAKHIEALKQAYEGNDTVKVSFDSKAFYPSDQAKFKQGVGVAAFKKTKGGMLYMNRIHTNKDTVYRRENIDFLVESSVRLSELV